MSRPPERQCRPRCSGEIEQCLSRPYDEHDCIAVDAGNPIRVDDFVKGRNIFADSAARKQGEKSRQHDYYIENREKILQSNRDRYRKKKRALLSGN